MAGWHHWLNGHEFEWTLRVGDGQGGLLCCNSWGLKESDTTEWQNWTELIHIKCYVFVFFFTWYYTCFNVILPNLPTLSLSHRVHKTDLYISVSFCLNYSQQGTWLYIVYCRCSLKLMIKSRALWISFKNQSCKYSNKKSRVFAIEYLFLCNLLSCAMH